jgi:serine/threonine-protein phosphatase 2A activator
MGAINYINESKIGPFHEHSPILFDMSGVPTWTKINSGLLKMYMAEVLWKFPVVQHLSFCEELFPFGVYVPSRDE